MKFWFYVSVAFWTASITAAYGQNLQKPAEKGFSGYIEAALLVIHTSNQLVFAQENDKIDDLKHNGGGFYAGGLPIMFDLRYTLSNLRTQFYLGTPADSLGGQVNLGIAHYFKDDSRLDVSLPMIQWQGWENPYETEKEREQTNIFEGGIDLAYEEILGTGLALYHNIRGVGVENDISGQRYPDLDREGQLSEYGVGYKFQLSRQQSLTPDFFYVKAEMNGASESFEGYEGGLNFKQMADQYSIEANASLKTRKYDKIHPLLWQIRKEDVYTADIIFTLPKPFGIKNAYSRFGAGYEYADTNINFFDYHTFVTGISLGYNF